MHQCTDRDACHIDATGVAYVDFAADLARSRRAPRTQETCTSRSATRTPPVSRRPDAGRATRPATASPIRRCGSPEEGLSPAARQLRLRRGDDGIGAALPRLRHALPRPGRPELQADPGRRSRRIPQGAPRPGRADHRLARRERRHPLPDAANVVSCVTSALAVIRRNLGTLVHRLRSAAGPGTTIVGTTYPDIFLGRGALHDSADQRIANLSILGFRGLINPALQSVYADGPRQVRRRHRGDRRLHPAEQNDHARAVRHRSGRGRRRVPADLLLPVRGHPSPHCRIRDHRPTGRRPAAAALELRR